MKNKKILTYALIGTFGILYLCTAFVSFYHAIEFFNLANDPWLSVILSLVAEIGQASVLFSLLASNDKNKILPWIIMGILTLLQVIGNVFSCYTYIERANAPEFLYFQKSILFFLEESPDVMKVVVAWIVGSILPIIALSMTALVENNIAELGLLTDNNKPVANDTESESLNKVDNVVINDPKPKWTESLKNKNVPDLFEDTSDLDDYETTDQNKLSAVPVISKTIDIDDVTINTDICDDETLSDKIDKIYRETVEDKNDDTLKSETSKESEISITDAVGKGVEVIGVK